MNALRALLYSPRHYFWPGRLIALAVFAAYVVLSKLYVEAGIIFALALIPAVPWILVKCFFGKALLIALAFGVGSALALNSNMQWVAMAIAFAGYLALFGYFIAGIANLFLSSVQLRDHGFDSDLEPVQMVWIYFSNSLLVAITLGLFIPWARCRLAHYRASRTSMLVAGDLNQFVAAEENRTSALGQELGDAFDVGFAAI